MGGVRRRRRRCQRSLPRLSASLPTDGRGRALLTGLLGVWARTDRMINALLCSLRLALENKRRTRWCWCVRTCTVRLSSLDT